MALFSVIDAKDAPITKDFTKITMPDGTVEVVRKLSLHQEIHAPNHQK